MSAPGDTQGGVGTSSRVWIRMPDGVRLAVTLHLPAGAGPSLRVPCLLEALPYRKDDLTASYRPEYVRLRDEHGYAVARVDLRGTGSSDGVLLDEYHPTEQAELHVVIAWLAGQPWCTGAIGMFGTSWSGFNSLQLAAGALAGLYLTAGPETFEVRVELEVTENGEPVATRTWQQEIPRRLA